MTCIIIERKNLISPLPRGGRRISSSAFLSRRPFGYYLPIASYGTIFAAKWSSNGGLEAVISKRLAQSHKGLTAHRCFLFCFSPPNASLFFVIDHTTKLGMKDLLKDQQLCVERYSNLIPPQYRPNALRANHYAMLPLTPCFPLNCDFSFTDEHFICYSVLYFIN